MDRRINKAVNATAPCLHCQSQATLLHAMGDSCGTIAELKEQVRQALSLADNLGLDLVGIDLCQALARLNEIDLTAPALHPFGDA